MNQELALRILSETMDWDNERAGKEFKWLELISHLKYDAYQDFLAGMRFIESLVNWLQQFSRANQEREIAYQFLRKSIVFISAAEMQHLVDLVYPETIQPRIRDSVARELNIPLYSFWSNTEAEDRYKKLLRQCLFLGLSDGARIDAFRRSCSGIINNEQVVVGTQNDRAKWNDLLKDLRKDLDDSEARFRFIFLIDDFMASGATLLRQEDSIWKGKLIRFWESVSDVLNTHFEPSVVVHVHHYIVSNQATIVIPTRNVQLGSERADWFKIVEFTYGTILPSTLSLNSSRDADFLSLVDKYYDPSIEDKHMKVGGGNAKLGFGGCAMPLILEHNTPNNSVAILWAETEGKNSAHAMRPLFRRRQRHT